MGFWTNLKKVRNDGKAANGRPAAADGEQYKERAQQLKEEMQKLQDRIRDLIEANKALRVECTRAAIAARTAASSSGNARVAQTLAALDAAAAPQDPPTKPLGSKPNPREVKESLVGRVHALLAEKRYLAGQVEGYNAVYSSVMRQSSVPAAARLPAGEPAVVDELLSSIFGPGRGGASRPPPEAPAEDDLMAALFEGSPVSATESISSGVRGDGDPMTNSAIRGSEEAPTLPSTRLNSERVKSELTTSLAHGVPERKEYGNYNDFLGAI
eukprot:TRINITY_DN30919_c0_g1_i1.p1 TRINITY_DN30919_c0_g1~~TRINITY_DN30919_c0_g1_i1.p1  ORF type:complete len:270 (+),score=80.31 TRINITY_DN30919_c0_g1_i1:97-906(+)